ncbi:TlpA disulfide reductase family protein [Meiothermus granaticius]|uniref:TlpA family protein disulfide reductase n=1 Tax=Meiothermus granaticius TaxID=863370 RepID=UPI002804F355|nr:TlpA disulfide reductase family protein [Meiothermus granaticius]
MGSQVRPVVALKAGDGGFQLAPLERPSRGLRRQPKHLGVGREAGEQQVGVRQHLRQRSSSRLESTALGPQPGPVVGVVGDLDAVRSGDPDHHEHRCLGRRRDGLADAAGKSYTLASFKGKPLVITFWASWCPICKAEFPKLH